MPDYGDRLSSEVVWSIKDYQSTTVVLYKEDYDHIIGRHPEMAKNEDAIKDTIADPDVVYRDKTHDDRASYYKKSQLAKYLPPKDRYYTKVIVETADMTWTDARIVTAFPHANAEGKETDKLYERDKKL